VVGHSLLGNAARDPKLADLQRRDVQRLADDLLAARKDQ
jgi:hypothetical protein